MWAGYFTSRPAFKAFVRESSAYMQAARQLQALVGGVTDTGPSNALFRLERAMGVAQHHDALTGTAKQVVNNDYELQLEAGRQDAFAGIAASLANATGYTDASFALCPLSNVTLCPALEAGTPVVILAYNSLGQATDAAPMHLAAGFPPGVASYAVFDATGAPVTAQLVPLSASDVALRSLYNGSSVPVQWLCFQGALPAAGFSAFFLIPAATAAAAPHTHASVVRDAPSAAGDVTVTNGRITLTISAATGWASAYSDSVTGTALPLAQSWASYIGFNGKSTLNGSDQASGAYIFRPVAGASPLQPGPAIVNMVTGPVVNITRHVYAYVSEEMRLWAHAGDVEVDWTVGPVDVSDGESHEVVTRYSSSVPSGGVWATDANCREAQFRRRNTRPQWTVNVSEPVSANYYPVNCLTRLSGGNVTLAVSTDRSQGGSSLVDGELELMVHRRMLFDDGRGVDQPLNEPGVDGNGLIIRGRHWFLAAPSTTAPPQYKALQTRALSLPQSLVAIAPLNSLSPQQWLAAHTASRSLLSVPLPANLHLTTVHSMSDSSLLLRLAHTYDAGEDAAGSANSTVGLAAFFSGRTVTDATDMTLPGAQPLADVRPVTYKVDGGEQYTAPILPNSPSGPALEITLAPQQIRTLRLNLR